MEKFVPTDGTKLLTVIAESETNGKTDMIQCIGVFADTNQAYGAAFLYLDELCTVMHGDYYITRAMELEGDTGYGMYLKTEKGETITSVYILNVLEK